MKIEYLIFFYMTVSILMGAFELCFLLYERIRDKAFDMRSKRMAEVLGREIEENADFPTEEHKRIIRKNMKRLAGLESFDLSMEQLQQTDAKKSERYLLGISSVFEYLIRYFASKSDLHKAYFAYIIRCWYRQSPASNNVITGLLKYVSEGSLYARQNALEALAQVGTAKSLVEALVTLENYVDFHHPKLITETTMAFRGSTEELTRELERRFQEFRPSMQAAIINYMRMRGGGDPELYFMLLQDSEENAEVRLACIRYFMRYPDPRVAPILRSMALSEDASSWEYAAVAVTALESYIDDETIAVLITCLSSPLWYVRFNAAKTLYDAGLSLEGPRLESLMKDGDRYAMDMLRYRWEIEKEVGSLEKGSSKKGLPAIDGSFEDDAAVGEVKTQS